MKTAVIYYSFEGNCALAAEILREELNPAGGAKLFEIKTADTARRRGAAKYLWGGLQVLTGKKPAILPLAFDPAGYDLIILGAPVWAGAPAPPLVSFLDTARLEGKRIALFCCHAGGPGRALEKCKALLPGNAFAGQIDFASPARNSAGLREKVRAWVETLRPPEP